MRLEFITDRFKIDYLKHNLKNYFKNRTIAFYIAFASAVLSLITAIVYAVVFAGSDGYMSWFGFVLLLLGAIFFAALTVFDCTKPAIFALALFSFFGTIACLLGTYGYFVGFVIGGGVDEALQDGTAVMFIICFIFMLICVIAANVAAWLKVQKTSSAESESFYNSVADTVTESADSSANSVPVADLADNSVENAAEEPAKNTSENAAEEPAKNTSENAAEEPANNTSENAAEEPANNTSENAAEEPAKSTSENAVKKAAKKPAKKPAKKSVDNSVADTVDN